MSLILNIDTTQETAHISIAENGKILKSKSNNNQKDHASFLHQAIQTLLNELSINIKQLSAVAVSNGPGSYTGLRVGISSAKGFCYALQKPLLAISSLKIIANDGLMQITDTNALICPMIDARRMEVFTAIYDNNLSLVTQPAALILENQSFGEIIGNKKIFFLGSGSKKFKTIIDNKNAFFLEESNLKASMAELSFVKYNKNQFDDLVNTEPLYLKEYQLFN